MLKKKKLPINIFKLSQKALACTSLRNKDPEIRNTLDITYVFITYGQMHQLFMHVFSHSFNEQEIRSCFIKRNKTALLKD